MLSEEPVTNRTRCAPWMTDLVHEMVHEYEQKVLTFVSSEGRAFFDAHRLALETRFGEGHEEMFCTSLALWAEYFGVSPETLFQCI
jgi:hypothetical protein